MLRVVKSVSFQIKSEIRHSNILSHMVVSRLIHPFILLELIKSVQLIRGEIVDKSKLSIGSAIIRQLKRIHIKGPHFFKNNLACVFNLVWLFSKFTLSKLWSILLPKTVMESTPCHWSKSQNFC